MTDEIVRNSEDWFDYAVDATLTITGKLESVGYGMPGTIMLTHFDWSSSVIECAHPRALAGFRVGSSGGDDVFVRCVRTEDGLTARAVWKSGGAPVPVA
jgi:hypothetical protein